MGLVLSVGRTQDGGKPRAGRLRDTEEGGHAVEQVGVNVANVLEGFSHLSS
jgi:hypothetical protein